MNNTVEEKVRSARTHRDCGWGKSCDSECPFECCGVCDTLGLIIEGHQGICSIIDDN